MSWNAKEPRFPSEDLYESQFNQDEPTDNEPDEPHTDDPEPDQSDLCAEREFRR